MIIDYSPLTGVADKVLYNCFVEAFSDYSVPIRTTLKGFIANNKLRGFDRGVSVGAFAGTKLIGFIMSGSGKWGGRPAAYDMGTGVVPVWRGKGVAERMMAELEKRLRRRGIKQYLLEVIKDNTPAVRLYKKNGFAVTREFVCFRSARRDVEKKLNAAALRPGLSVRAIPKLVRKEAAKFWGWEPSWQNSSDSLDRSPGEPAWFGAFSGNRLVGYGAVKPQNGDIPQLAVGEEWRRRGAGSALLKALLGAVSPERQTVSCLNIDSSDAASRAFFEARGFAVLARQLEMLKQY